MHTMKNLSAIKNVAIALLIGLTGAAQAGIPIQHWTQPSGAGVWLVESPTVPMVDVRVDFDAGGRRDPAGQTGLAGVSAAMMSKGIRAAGASAAGPSQGARAPSGGSAVRVTTSVGELK
jgi:zinc protease